MFGEITEIKPEKSKYVKLDTPCSKADPDPLQEWKRREEKALSEHLKQSEGVFYE